MTERMKIGLDFHGVIDKVPKFFSCVTKALINSGHEVHIITGGTNKEIKKYCKENKIYYTVIHSVVSDFLKKKMKHLKSSSNRYTFDNLKWNRAKAEYCKRNQINFHIDDTLDYARYFKTPFILFEKKGKI